jgi:hypothetical protein
MLDQDSTINSHLKKKLNMKGFYLHPGIVASDFVACPEVISFKEIWLPKVKGGLIQR